MYHSTQEIPMQVVEALRIALGKSLIAVVLFGSQARGEAAEGSDWDVLVIAEGFPERLFARHLWLKRLLPSHCRGTVSLLARTPAEFEAHLPSLYLDIGLDGYILYDPQGYAAARLAALRRLIEQAGLYRERTEVGDMWHWRKEASTPLVLEWEP